MAGGIVLHIRTHKGSAIQKARALALSGILFMFVGLAFIGTSYEVKEGRTEIRPFKAQFMLFDDLWVWGVFFFVSGAVALFCAVKRQLHVGFGILMLMSSWWGGLLAASLLATHYIRIIPNILIWFLVSMFFYTLSSWPVYPDEEEVRREMENEK